MMAVPDMSHYERKTYETLIRPPKERRSLIPDKVRESISNYTGRAQVTLKKMPGNEQIEASFVEAMQGMKRVTTDLGMASVSVEREVKRYKKHGIDVSAPADIQKLDLEICDRLLPNRKWQHYLVATAEGTATSALITGVEIATTVTAGATVGIVIGTVAIDSVAFLTGLGRMVGDVGVNYGFDLSLPEEQLFALQVIGLAFATNHSDRISAFAGLSRLTQQMMRRATWSQLNKRMLVRVVNKAYITLGLRLTQRKLAQTIPGLGVFLSVGINALLVQRTHEAAEHAYRFRFLTEKYGLENPLASAAYNPGPNDDDQDAAVRIDEFLDLAVGEINSDRCGS